MSTMHALGFLHGDINPENMLLVDGKVTLRGLEYAQKIDEGTIKRQWLHQVRLQSSINFTDPSFMIFAVENDYIHFTGSHGTAIPVLTSAA